MRDSATITPFPGAGDMTVRPMDCIAGAGRYLDCYIPRREGSVLRPWFVAWCDIATHRLHATLFSLARSEAIGVMHIAESFAGLTADPEYGAPMTVYVGQGARWAEFASAAAPLGNTEEYRGSMVFGDEEGAGDYRGVSCSPPEVLAANLGLLDGRLSQVFGFPSRDPEAARRSGGVTTIFPGEFSELKEGFGRIVHTFNSTPQPTFDEYRFKDPLGAQRLREARTRLVQASEAEGSRGE